MISLSVAATSTEPCLSKSSLHWRQQDETVALTQPTAPPPERTREAAWLPAGWPVLLVLYGFPALWILGLSKIAWILVAPIMVAHLWGRRTVYAPRGTGLWALLLIWCVLSIFMVDSFLRGAVWSLRWGAYLAAGVCLVYGYNLDRGAFRSSRLIGGFAYLWMLIVAGGFAGLFFGDVTFPSALQAVLPASLAVEPYVLELVQPVVAQIHDFLGFPVGRPAAPFTFTNEWGSILALMSPFLVAWASGGGAKRRIFATIVGLAAVAPIVHSLNRGLWLSLGAGMAYAAVVYALRGKAGPLIALGTASTLVAIILVVSPLGDLVGARLETGHSDSRRLDLYSQSIERVQESPLIGHGGTVRDPEQLGRAPAGTHGQIWMLLVSYGIPAAALFVAFMIYAWWRTSGAEPGSFAFWVNVTVVVAIVQLPFYSLTPTQLPILMLAVGVALRDLDARHAGRADDLAHVM